eukprot:m.115971 g.115971  ORF g.115971 m.115971 type:complete len:536 (-) comp9179_c0_seq3:233-1840(-)
MAEKAACMPTSRRKRALADGAAGVWRDPRVERRVPLLAAVAEVGGGGLAAVVLGAAFGAMPRALAFRKELVREDGGGDDAIADPHLDAGQVEHRETRAARPHSLPVADVADADEAGRGVSAADLLHCGKCAAALQVCIVPAERLADDIGAVCEDLVLHTDRAGRLVFSGRLPEVKQAMPSCDSCHTARLCDEFLDLATCRCEHLSRICIECLWCTDKAAPGKICPSAVCPACKRALDRSETAAMAATARPYFDLGGLDPTAALAGSSTTVGATAGVAGAVVVSMLNGEQFSVAVTPDMTVEALMGALAKQCDVPVPRQRLYLGNKLLERHRDRTPVRLSDCGVTAGSSLQLIVALLDAAALQAGCTRVSLDLSWTNPVRGPDYLDGTCLFFNGSTFVNLLDYHHTGFSGSTHSGDQHTETGCTHRIALKLDSLPAKINLAFFVLSAWNSPTIAAFRSPRVGIVDERNTVLSDYEIRRAAASQAVIICALLRGSNGWESIALEVKSSGNAKDYEPIKRTIMEQVTRLAVFQAHQSS